MSMPLGLDAADELKRTGRSKWLQIGAIVAGAAGLGALVWFLLFRKKPEPDKDAAGNLTPTGAAKQGNTAWFPQLNSIFELDTADCETLHRLYTLYTPDPPSDHAKVLSWAKIHGCPWATPAPGAPPTPPPAGPTAAEQAAMLQAAQFRRAQQGGFGGL